MPTDEEIRNRLREAFHNAYEVQDMSVEVKDKDKSPPVIDIPMQVYVVGGGLSYIQMFYKHGCIGAKSVDEADVVVFTGGEDVSPSLYGEAPLQKTITNAERDKREEEIFWKAAELGIPMVGICRGAQLLHVLNDGKLWQDVNNHRNGRHEAFDLRSGTPVAVNVTSTHHQMMMPPDKKSTAQVMVAAKMASEKQAYGKLYQRTVKNADDLDDPEVIWYPDTQCLCFQPHPEWGSMIGEDTCKLFWDIFDETIEQEIFISAMKGEK